MTQNKKIILFAGMMLLLSGIAGIPEKPSPPFMDCIFETGGVSLVFSQDDQDTDAPETQNNAESAAQETPDPAKVMFRGLEEKKQAIAEQRKLLEQEKKELRRYENQIDEKLAALEVMKEQIQNDLAELEEKKSQKEQQEEAAYEAKLNRLVKMYAGMKPKDAAQIVDEMTLEVAREIFLRMRETSASQILSFVDSQKAAKISERLAFKNR
ncbi:MAG: hypothetical protein R6V15_10350 [Desulfotignum sp.]